ncbi:MAG: hypothetical protein AAF697_12325 [Pseudomonadota bacterium]
MIGTLLPYAAALAGLLVLSNQSSRPTVSLSGPVTIATAEDGTSASIRPWQVRQKSSGESTYREAFVTFARPEDGQVVSTLEIARYRCAEAKIDDLSETRIEPDGTIDETVFEPFRERDVTQLDPFRAEVFNYICRMELGS